MVVGLTNDFDGAWHAVFGAQLGGEGIVLPRNGFTLGCDDQYFYEGRYVFDDDDGAFRALVKVSHYAGDRAVSIAQNSTRHRAAKSAARSLRMANHAPAAPPGLPPHDALTAQGR
jgi:hypothetical protein